jgi:hypothetical protein
LKSKLKEQFGELKMPTLASLYVKVEEIETVFPGEIIHLRKSDVARAFQRLNWSPQTSLLMAWLLSEEYVLVPTSMGFGSTAGPYGYGLVTRFFEFMNTRIVTTLCLRNPLTNQILDSLGIIYVDDELDVGPKALLQQVGEQCARVVRVTLGDDAFNDLKDKITTKDTTLGVLSDFENKVAAPGWRAYLKLVYVFFKLLPLQLATDTTVSLRFAASFRPVGFAICHIHPSVASNFSEFFGGNQRGEGNAQTLIATTDR